MMKSYRAASIIALAGLFYLLVLPRYPVGYPIDDALYILGAQALLGGRYINLCLPGHIPLTDPLPGFPLFIAPFVALVQPHWLSLKLLMVVLTLVTGVLVYALFQSWLMSAGATVVWLLYALNPTTVNFSGIVVSEPCFLLFTLLIFFLLEKWLPREKRLFAIFLGVLLGWATLIRPQGVVLLVSIGAAMAWARRWRMLLNSVGTGVLIWGFELASNALLTRSPTGYLQHWQATLPAIQASPALLFQNAAQVTKTLLAENILGLPAYPATIAYASVVGFLVLLAGALALMGMVNFLNAASPARTLRLAMVLFVVLYYGIHVFWTAVDMHYLYPILPFLLAFLVAGWRGLASRLKLPHFWSAAVFALLLVRYLYCDLYAIPGVFQPAFQVPTATYTWMRAHLPSTSIVYTPAAPTVRLYTGCYAMYANPPADMNAFHPILFMRGIHYVLAQPVNLLTFSHYKGESVDTNTRWAQSERWMQEHPAIFKPIYHSPDEETTLYSVAKN